MTLHASCVAIDGRGVLILGPSGAGKSALALQLLALGAVLVADDRVLVTRGGDQLYATAPPQISGLIEARFVGILTLPVIERVPLVLAVDLAQTETDRLPVPRHLTLHGLDLPLLHKAEVAHFPFALMCYVRQGWVIQE